ncbi:hypothetical protein SCP_0500800 [Sparassis crispa]|uniref:Uncharacterized protein n=1 Tax=Sparassis crispa TaxID=139825 RepID=A0A401GLH6_9APHY|nr:hypothetical protein SCP_0500800 [Sparassis crispa]GBE83037.1 hypothetical protein SCP_0500800 [Sparassis crispa]
MPSSKSSRMLQTTSPLPRASSSTALDDSKNARTRQWLTRPLDRADLATGLHAVSERLQGADLAEDEWIVSLLSELAAHLRGRDEEQSRYLSEAVVRLQKA